MCRDRIIELLSHGVGAEIGVWRGDFSERLLERSSELHLIDPWLYTTDYGPRWYGGTIAKNQKDMDLIFLSVVEKFNNSKVFIHKMDSYSAANLFPNNFFDWVYIDGNHYYEFVLGDLEVYFV